MTESLVIVFDSHKFSRLSRVSRSIEYKVARLCLDSNLETLKSIAVGDQVSNYNFRKIRCLRLFEGYDITRY